MQILHGFTGSFTAVLIKRFYTVSRRVLQGFCYMGPTQFYWAFYRGSTIELLQSFTGSSTGVLLYTFLHNFTRRSTGVLL